MGDPENTTGVVVSIWETCLQCGWLVLPMWEVDPELSQAVDTKSLLLEEQSPGVSFPVLEPPWEAKDLSQCLSFPTGVPSGPRNVISIVNETSIILEWHPPRETGGRDDVTYNIVCKKCRSDRRACSRCDDNVDFVPRQLGLTDTRVFISNLWAHTPYTFEIQAVNGVSSKSPFPQQHVSVNITTNQAGESRWCCGVWLSPCAGDSCQLCVQKEKFRGCEGV